MEEACSYWSRRVAWRCFLAAMLASFVIGQLHQRCARLNATRAECPSCPKAMARQPLPPCIL